MDFSVSMTVIDALKHLLEDFLAECAHYFRYAKNVFVNHLDLVPNISYNNFLLPMTVAQVSVASPPIKVCPHTLPDAKSSGRNSR